MHLRQHIAKRCNIDFLRLIVGKHPPLYDIERMPDTLFLCRRTFAELPYGSADKELEPRHLAFMYLDSDVGEFNYGQDDLSNAAFCGGVSRGRYGDRLYLCDP